MEKFVLIPGMDNYAVSNAGNVINVKTKRVLKQEVTKGGYLSVSVCQNNMKKTLRVHRLVGLCFVSNPDNKPYINHKDGNKKNNCASNLEWVTAKENDTHARETGLKHENKPIEAIDLGTGERFQFYSISEAGAFLGINKGTISKVLAGKRTKVHGYEFRYIAS